jgi:hypothetical protein
MRARWPGFRSHLRFDDEPRIEPRWTIGLGPANLAFSGRARRGLAVYGAW